MGAMENPAIRPEFENSAPDFVTLKLASAAVTLPAQIRYTVSVADRYRMSLSVPRMSWPAESSTALFLLIVVALMSQPPMLPAVAMMVPVIVSVPVPVGSNASLFFSEKNPSSST